MLEVRRGAAPGAVEVDDVQRPRAVVDPALGGVERVGVVDGLRVEVPLVEAHRLAVEDVDRRQQDHARAAQADREPCAQPGEALEHPQSVGGGLLGVKLDAEHEIAGDDRREPLAVLGRADDVGRLAGPRREASARGRTGSPRGAGPSVSGDSRSNRTSFQPMCGTRSPPASSRVTSPLISPSPSVGSSSSERSNSSCMPRQIPSIGVAADGGVADQAVQAELAEVAHRQRERADARHDEPVGERGAGRGRG